MTLFGLISALSLVAATNVATGRTETAVMDGLPRYEIRADGFYVDGVKTVMRGVCYHQDTAERGWAMTPEDEERDIRLIKEMGANAIRTSHYPRGPHFYELCDKYGIYVWTEVPLVDAITPTPAFRENTLACAREMVEQNRKYKCIAMWGLFNELYLKKMPGGTAEPLVREVNDLVKSLDPTRPTVCAIAKWDRIELNAISDAVGLNDYPGWYGGVAEAILTDVERCLVYNHRTTIAVSEFGAGGSVKQHENPLMSVPDPGGRWHPEERETDQHIRQYRVLMDDPRIWGFYIWQMFDSASDSRCEGDANGINDKGLVTRDRQVKKDAYFFYKANWNPEPMVHLCSSRMTETTNAVFDAIGFCNAGDVTLFLNGAEIGTKGPDAVKTVRWEGVPLASGLNRIALAAKDGSLVSEMRIVRKVPGLASDPFPEWAFSKGVPAASAKPDVPAKAQWFADARFGLFVHWGLYSIPAKGEWIYARGDWKPGEYEGLKRRFNPSKYDPRDWARRAKAAGMKYAVLTTRHHDGFCMFDSRFTDYKITNTPYGKDAVRAFVEAFRAEGLKVGFYHSLPDWTHRGYEDPESPEYIRSKKLHVPTEAEKKAFQELLYNHVHQLMTEYGKIDLIFFDYTSKYKTDLDTFDRNRLLRMVRECQPEILVNDRLSFYKDAADGFDYYTPEITVPGGPIRVGGQDVLWETCATMNDSWGYRSDDSNWKTPEAVVAGLVGCVSRNGNLLLNIGPTELGEIPQGSVRILDALAQWNAANGEAIAGCGASRFVPPFGCAYTQRGDDLYLHFLQPPLGDTILPGLRGCVAKATVLRTGEPVELVNLWGFELLPFEDQRIRTRGLVAGDVIKVQLKSGDSRAKIDGKGQDK